MRKFLLGFITAVFVVLLAGFLCVRFGLMDSRADIPVNSMERSMAMPSVDASVMHPRIITDLMGFLHS